MGREVETTQGQKATTTATDAGHDGTTQKGDAATRERHAELAVSRMADGKGSENASAAENKEGGDAKSDEIHFKGLEQGFEAVATAGELGEKLILLGRFLRMNWQLVTKDAARLTNAINGKLAPKFEAMGLGKMAPFLKSAANLMALGEALEQLEELQKAEAKKDPEAIKKARNAVVVALAKNIPIVDNLVALMFGDYSNVQSITDSLAKLLDELAVAAKAAPTLIDKFVEFCNWAPKLAPLMKGEDFIIKLLESPKMTEILGGFHELEPVLKKAARVMKLVTEGIAVAKLVGVIRDPHHTSAQYLDAIHNVALTCGGDVVGALVTIATGNPKAGELASQIGDIAFTGADLVSNVVFTGFFKAYYATGELGDPQSAKQQFDTFGALAIDEYNATTMFKIKNGLDNVNAARFEEWKQAMWAYHKFKV